MLIEVKIIRRSVNTNAFGLRGIWAVETYKSEEGHQVWSFAANMLDAEQMPIGATVKIRAGNNGRPQYELLQSQGHCL